MCAGIERSHEVAALLSIYVGFEQTHGVGTTFTLIILKIIIIGEISYTGIENTL
jgi:hypothetical protein